MRKLKQICVVIGVVLLGMTAACTKEQTDWFTKVAAPEQQAEVIKALQTRPTPTGDCYSAMRATWPQAQWRWAEGIIYRESRNSPTAYNKSGATGCFQLLGHQDLINRHGGNGFNPVTNCLAAYDLYRAAGTSPWRL